MIDYINWDSRFFNLKIGKVETNSLTLGMFEKLMFFKRIGDYDLIYLFAKSIENEVSEEFKTRNIAPVDEKVIFSKNVTIPKSLPSNIEIYSASLTSSLLKLALLSGHKSRFNKDLLLKQKFEMLYKLWIQKSISGEMADVVFVARSGENFEGFVTVKKNNMHGQIGLIAVAPEAQGKGLGSQLMNTADYWCWQNNLKTCSVITQQDNPNACLLYEKTGYKKENVELVFHI